MSIAVTDTKGRSHRTALFIDADALVDSVYAERVARLLQSLNGQNIKTDLFKVAAGNGAGVVRISSLDDAGHNGEVVKPSDAELSAWAEDQGYVQVLFSKPAGA